MIEVKQLDGTQIALNAELIETVKAHPDTVITLTNGNKYLVKESVQEVLLKIREYRKIIAGGIL